MASNASPWNEMAAVVGGGTTAVLVVVVAVPFGGMFSVSGVTSVEVVAKARSFDGGNAVVGGQVEVAAVDFVVSSGCEVETCGACGCDELSEVWSGSIAPVVPQAVNEITAIRRALRCFTDSSLL